MRMRWRLGLILILQAVLVILLLMLDQAIFTITDTAMGVAADRVAKLVGRLSVFVGLLTAISCAAFVASVDLAPGVGFPRHPHRGFSR